MNNNQNNDHSTMIVDNNTNNEEKDTNILTSFKREQEFFSYHPLAFIDDVNEAIFEIIAIDAADYIEECLQTHPTLNPPDPNITEKITEGTNRVWKLLDNSFKKNLDKFEEFLLSNTFKIPDDLVLPHEQHQQHNNSLYHSTNEGNNNLLEKQLEELRTKIINIQQENEDKRNQNQQLQSELNLLKSWDNSLSLVSQTNIEKDIIPTFNNINHKKRDLSYSFNLIKKRLAENNININNNNSSTTSKQQLKEKKSNSNENSQLCNNINSLTLDEFIREKNEVEQKTKEMTTIQNHL